MRRAGHAGQLSATVPAIDRFRILALLKLLAGDNLDARRRQAVCAVLAEKCAIYAQGLRRRGRGADAVSVAEVSARANTSWRQQGGTSIHDAIEATIAIIVPEASGVMPEASGVVAETAA